jgi:Tfp pilus assembly protein PilO
MKTKMEQAVSLAEQRMQQMMLEEREEQAQRLCDAKKEAEELRQRLNEFQLEKQVEGLEIRRIQEQQEKIEEEYKGLRESLSV